MAQPTSLGVEPLPCQGLTDPGQTLMGNRGESLGERKVKRRLLFGIRLNGMLAVSIKKG